LRGDHFLAFVTPNHRYLNILDGHMLLSQLIELSGTAALACYNQELDTVLLLSHNFSVVRYEPPQSIDTWRTFSTKICISLSMFFTE
jgi:hypothetical protein